MHIAAKRVCVKMCVVGFSAHDARGHVGAVVGNALQICENFKENNTAFDAADTVLQAQNVTLAQHFNHQINRFFQRLDALGALNDVAR